MIEQTAGADYAGNVTAVGKGPVVNELPVYPEQDVIGPLLIVPAFEAFYRAERARIPWPVYWTLDTAIPPGIAAIHTHYWPKPGSDDTDYALIRLPRIPPDHPLAVAHELSHSILDAEGYPSAASRAPDSMVATALTSLLTDPVISRRLFAYGFDVRADVRRQLKQVDDQLKDADAPDDPITLAQWIFTTTGLCLEYEVATGGDPAEFLSRFEARFPTAGRAVRQLLDTIRRSGYDTPDQQRRLLERIIHDYDLAQWGVWIVKGKSSGPVAS
jgi:hypothetical protein